MHTFALKVFDSKDVTLYCTTKYNILTLKHGFCYMKCIIRVRSYYTKLQIQLFCISSKFSFYNIPNPLQISYELKKKGIQKKEYKYTYT